HRGPHRPRPPARRCRVRGDRRPGRGPGAGTGAGDDGPPPHLPDRGSRMTPRLPPAERRTALRLRPSRTQAAAQILAEEEAAEAARKPSVDALVAARTAELTSTQVGRDRFAAYLDRLSVTYAQDPRMLAFVRRSRALLADAAGPDPVDGPTRTAPADIAPRAARLDRSPQVAAATEGDLS